MLARRWVKSMNRLIWTLTFATWTLCLLLNAQIASSALASVGTVAVATSSMHPAPLLTQDPASATLVALLRIIWCFGIQCTAILSQLSRATTSGFTTGTSASRSSCCSSLKSLTIRCYRLLRGSATAATPLSTKMHSVEDQGISQSAIDQLRVAEQRRPLLN